jgi:glycosyltransferase involved in cell wall biosynthesis
MSARVHQVLATLGYGDAIGHEVLGIQRALQHAGYESEVFVETADRRLESLTTDYREMVGTIAPDDILIHHFSIGSRASRVAYAMPGRMALVYHNITPPEYFLGVHKDLVKLCFRGRRELTAYTSRADLALGDSEYNRQELQHLGFHSTGVLPVVPDFTHLDVPPNTMTAAEFDDAWTNLLFVGRVIPNKKFEDVIRAFHVYRTRHNLRSRLLLVGSYDGFERYFAMLQGLIASLGTPDVHFLGHISNEELTAVYDIADLFLCASEHEGFCVPLIESFYKRVPVLAFAATAVPATMDGAGVLYDVKDPFEIARLMAAVLDEEDIEARVLASQDAALTRLLEQDFSGTLLRFVDTLRVLGPRPAPDVPWDFWPQFDQAERLEELRQFRPALYRALPVDPQTDDGLRMTDEGRGRMTDGGGQVAAGGPGPEANPPSADDIGHPPSAIRHPPSDIGHPPSAIRYPPSTIK